MDALLWQGIELMLVGMGTVFAFLTLLVLATTLMSRLVLRLQPVPAQASDGGSPPPAQRQEEVAAIAAALELHRRRH